MTAGKYMFRVQTPYLSDEDWCSAQSGLEGVAGMVAVGDETPRVAHIALGFFEIELPSTYASAVAGSIVGEVNDQYPGGIIHMSPKLSEAFIRHRRGIMNM